MYRSPRRVCRPPAPPEVRDRHLRLQRLHLAAKGTLVQVCGDSFPAEGALPHLHSLMSYSAHESAKKGTLFQAKRRGCKGQGEVMYMATGPPELHPTQHGFAGGSLSPPYET